ncbi:DUF342 domain-containing protein [Paenibacillus sp. L3-i20]|uniref:DUF342 domain-containing protein n=1 Tax=Paenibacillus sp. L3-i20 TaxID=2905833 RepID=UPI001EDD73BE|nr:FapA family protein [Paenibacillus sp. L3-i20]GKU78652.1 hypothetical protein L3i20_v230490 [Paenibacillus sp. L3-i20]
MDHQQLDSYLRIQTSADKLSAFITFNRITDEFSTVLTELEVFVRSKGIVHGIKLDVLEQICINPLAYCREQTLIAQGKSSAPGSDGLIRYVFEVDNGQRKPAEDLDGKIDLKEVTQLKNVKRGQLIAELVEPQPGPAGMTVTGEVIEPKHGKRVRFKIGKNVVMNGEQTSLYAAIDGLITMTDKGKVNVFPVYEVNGDVNYSVGNIDFVGTVVIRGNVLNGFRVRASGDIRVIGGVEGAELESDGSIEITSGIMAGNKGYVKAAVNVKSSFIQDGNVYAGEDVLVSQSIMHSAVKAGRNVICSGAKGLIVGGMVQAGEVVLARTMGNAMSTATTIEVGVNPQLREELLELRSTIKQSIESNEKSEKALAILDQLASAGQLTPDRLALRTKLNATKRQSVTMIDESKTRMLEIEKMLEDTERSRIDISGTVYSGTKIVIGRYTKFVKDSAQRITFRLMDGDIALVPYHN